MTHPRLNILLIEDEMKTASALKKGLEENNCSVDLAFDGESGYALARKNQYNVIISDVVLPKLSGFDLCKNLRENGIQTPLLMLSALGAVDDKVKGFEYGADDYLSKPFEFKELQMRILALYKRQNSLMDKGNVLKISDLELNLDTKTAFRAGKEIALTAKEFALMEYLMRNRNKVVSKMDIAEKVWDINFESGTNIIEVYLNYLRKKIDFDPAAKLIHTVHGFGYILKEN